MGVFSKYHRYREAGEQANVNNVERFGEPARSLFVSSKVFSLHQHTDITDDRGQVVYQAQSKVLSIRDKTDLFDASGRHVSHIERKLFSFHERHFVTMESGMEFQLSNELFHLFKDVTNLEGLGWQLRGNIAGLNFELYDESGAIVATIGQKMFSIHDKYCIDIYRPEHEEIVVTILIALKHIIRDRENQNSISFSSSSSNGN